MVSAIIPARNEEASIARTIESVAAQPEIDEIIVVNDQSTDCTAQILSQLSVTISKLRTLYVEKLPPGWVGKNYAASLGAAAACGEWLLFTDADTFHMLGSTRRALTDAVDHAAVLVSYSPEQELGSFWERALIPMVYSRLSKRFPFGRVNNPGLPDAAANGQFLMILREVYEKIGGHAAVANQILEDVALASRVKDAGYGIYFTAPLATIQTRMYRTFPAMWQGWTKNLCPLMGGSSKRMLREIIDVFPLFFLVGTLIFYWLLLRSHQMSMWTSLGLVVVALGAFSLWRGFSLYRNPNPLSAIKYYVPAVCLYTAVLISSWWKNTRGRVIWKGRSYPPAA
jgi:cellulose synthase/poly-beta-1,6-N-acetylglucosamine synthase-like glycosyltransferase